MKSQIRITVVTLFLVATTLQLNAQKGNNNTITGSGNVITKTVQTKVYSALNISGSMDVYLENGNEGNISIEAEDNVQERIVVESDGTTLTISMKNNTSLRNTKKIKITVPVQEINEITLRGSGDIEGRNLLKSTSLALSIQGSGEIKISVDTNSLNAKIKGSGDIKISGIAKEVEVTTTGSGDFEGKELISENAQISISGSGDSTIHAKNSINAKINGSGSVFYAGNPSTNNVQVRGSGKVKSI